MRRPEMRPLPGIDTVNATRQSVSTRLVVYEQKEYIRPAEEVK